MHAKACIYFPLDSQLLTLVDDCEGTFPVAGWVPRVSNTLQPLIEVFFFFFFFFFSLSYSSSFNIYFHCYVINNERTRFAR